jgi:thioredoxin reductase
LEAILTNNKFNLNTKICIISAGASGLTVAYLLRKKGYKNITILEKENGEIMNFPSLRGVTEYSNYLIHKYF